MLGNRLNRRRFLALLGSTASVALLSACAGGAAPAATQAPAKQAEEKAPEKAAAGPTAPAVSEGTSTGTFWFNQPVQADAFKAVIDKFHSSQSKYKMNVVLVPQTEMTTKLATAIAGGEPPTRFVSAGRSSTACSSTPVTRRCWTTSIPRSAPTIGFQASKRPSAATARCTRCA